MAQIKTVTWTNANPAVARDQDIGFAVSEVITIDTTNGGSWQWVSGMADASYLDIPAGTITLTNGFTPLSQSARFGAAISGFTNANPGVITVGNTADFGFAAGDTVTVSNIADDLTATSLNGDFTIASVTATTITLSENTSAYSVYVSGGFVHRVSDTNGDAVAIENQAIRGGTLGTGIVGANSAVMVAVFKGEEPVT